MKKYLLLILLLLMAIGGIPDSCFGQIRFPARIPSGTSLDTNLDYVGTATATTGGSTTLDVTYTIPSGHTNKLLIFECGIENYVTVSITSVQRTGTSTNLTNIGTSIPAGADRQATTAYYLLDADLPTSGDVTIRITCGSSEQMAGRIRFYNGAHQTTPISNATTYETCGSASSTLTVDGNDMGYTWTTNACVSSVGCKVNGASTGSQYIEVTTIDGDQSVTNVTLTGSGHTALGNITSVLPWTYWGYK